MVDVMEMQTSARTRKLVGVKANTRLPVLKRARTLMISDETWEKLTVYALRSGKDRSECAEALMHAALRRYVVQDRGGPGMEVGSANGASGVNDSVETLPMSESVTSSEALIEGGHVGEGEGTGDPAPAPPAHSKRRQRA